jgi:hypothetical protein
MPTNRDDFGIAFRSALLQKGAKQKFSLFFFICLSIFILFLGNTSSNISNVVRKTLNDGIYRASVIASSPVTFFKYSTIITKSHFAVHQKNQILSDMKLANQKFEEFILKTIEEPKLKAAKEKKIIKEKQLAEEKKLRDKQLTKEKKLRDKQLTKEKMSNEIKKWWKSF